MSELCRFYFKGKNCLYGSKCRFSHVDPNANDIDTITSKFENLQIKKVPTFTEREYYLMRLTAEANMLKKQIAVNVKTQMCKYFTKDGKCPHRVCKFAHDKSELVVSGADKRNASKCTRMCWTVASGITCPRPYCTFAHSAEELRTSNEECVYGLICSNTKCQFLHTKYPEIAKDPNLVEHTKQELEKKLKENLALIQPISPVPYQDFIITVDDDLMTDDDDDSDKTDVEDVDEYIFEHDLEEIRKLKELTGNM